MLLFAEKNPPIFFQWLVELVQKKNINNRIYLFYRGKSASQQSVNRKAAWRHEYEIWNCLLLY